MPKKYKIIFYAHDGSGFGHLMRICRLALRLQKGFTCLVLTGTPEAFWFVDSTCEYIKLPSWDKMFRHPLNNNSEELWHEISKEKVVRLRTEIISSIIKAFKPDAIVVDYLPHGLRNELSIPLKENQFKKYLLLRGIVDSCDDELRSKLSSNEIAMLYDRFLIAADKRVIKGNNLPLSKKAKIKSTWIGYMANYTESSVMRSNNCIDPKFKTWVVCSAGSGLRGESLFAHCIQIAKNHPTTFFDIVMGTRSKPLTIAKNKIGKNIRLSEMRPDLPYMHNMADVVVTSGGYNSLIEAISGGAEVVVIPVNKGKKDEQLKHAKQIMKYYPVKFSQEISDLPFLLDSAIQRARKGKRNKSNLDLNGVNNAYNIIRQDFFSKSHNTKK